MFKKHILFQILYIIVGPLCPASLKHHKPLRKCNAPFHNLIKIKVKTVNSVLSFTISSSRRGEQSQVTDTVMKLIWRAVMWPCLSLSLSHTHTHTHTHTRAQAAIKGIVHFEIKIWYLSAYPKGIQDVGVFFSSVDPILMF